MVRWLKSPWVLGVAASIGAGVPPLLVPQGWPLVWRSLIAAAVAGLAGASGSYFGVVLSRAEDAAAAREALETILDPLSVPKPAPFSPSDREGEGKRSALEVLLPQWCPTPFWGRRAELDRWWDWCHREALSGVMLLDGPGGCGKTRLALRAARQAAEAGWLTGWLREGTGAALVEAAAVVQGARVLVLVDDADTRTDLAPLLAALANYRGGARFRVVLITRNGPGLGEALKSRLPEPHALLVTRAPVMSLRPLGQTSDLVRWYGEATRAFAAAWGLPAPPVPETTAPVRAGQTMVEVLAAASVAVLRHAAPGGSPAPPDEVARVLFEHEVRWWRATAAQPRWAVGPVTDLLLERVLVTLTLLAPTGEQDAAAALRRVPELADAPAERVTNLARWAHALYPATGPLRVAPDLLVDWFTTVRLTGTDGDRRFAAHLLRNLGEEDAGRVLTVLARAGEHHSAARLLFEQVLGGDPVRLARHAIYAALTTSHPRVLDRTTAAALAAAELDPDTTTRLRRLVSAISLPCCAITLDRRRLHHTRATGTPLEIADALDRLRTTLGWMGEEREGVEPARKVVALHREAAAGDPVHRSRLARSLSDLGVVLERVGEERESMEVVQEAVGVYRELAAVDPAHRSELARALTNLASAWGYLGEAGHSARVAQESAELYREVAADDPAERPRLAPALINLAGALSRVGQDRQGVEVAREAVALCRELAADDPAYRPELARALMNLDVTLGRVGEDRQSVEAAREAVAMCRELAADNPAFRPYLARSLTNLGVTLRRVGQHRQVLQADREAVALYRQAAADNPAHRKEFARSLINLAGAMSGMGENRQSVEVAREAVALSRELAADNPAHRLFLATSLTNLGVTLQQVGEDLRRLEADREAVALYRQVAADNPVERPYLANSLHNLALALDQVGEHGESVVIARETVALCRELAAEDPQRFEQLYIDVRAKLRRKLSRRGDETDAIILEL